MFSSLKAFLMKGNVLDLAVGVIIGGAFSKIIDSLVSKVLMPVLGMLMGGVDINTWGIKVGEANLNYGAVIQSIIEFLMVGIALYYFLRAAGQKPGEAAPDAGPSSTDVLLGQIRDELRKR